MSCSTILRLLFLIFVFCLLGLVRAMPANLERYSPRQAGGLSSPTTLVTTQTSQTKMGPMTQTCTITLTPVTDANGNSAVQEVKSCTVTTDAGSGSLGNSQAPSESPSTTGTSSSTTTSSASSSSTSPSTSLATSSSAGTSSASTVASPPTTTATSSSDSSSSSSSSSTAAPSTTQDLATPVTTLGISASGTPSSAVTSSPAPPPSVPPAASSASPGGPVAGGGAKAAATPASAVPSAVSAVADATASSDSSFSVPGKHLSVLPIGLGVFAGISVIALIIVGLVTYERTKYRKAFRQRKLAEAGSITSYSGMAQRTP